MLMASVTATPYLFKSRIKSAKYLQKITQFNKSTNSEPNKHFSIMQSSPKPLNILLYGKTKEADFDFIKAMQNVLCQGRFTVYSISNKSLLTDPWMDTAKLLVITRKFEDNKTNVKENKIIEQFVTTGGKILDFSAELLQIYGLSRQDNDSEIQFIPNAASKQISHLFNFSSLNKKQVVLCEHTSGGKAIVCQLPMPMVQTHLREFLFKLGFESEELQSKDESGIPFSTPYFVFADSQSARDKFINSLKSGKPNNVKLFPENEFQENVLAITDESDHVIVYSDEINQYNQNMQKYLHFNWKDYHRNLSTSTHGRVVLYSDVTSSTMDVLSNLITSDPGVVTVIANQQTSGRGRGGNKWLSPIGCAMFTVCFSIPLQSAIGQNISVTQHMMALAMVQAVRKMDGLGNVNLKIKWPNDIYIGEKHKIGGILTKSSIFGNKVFLYIGMGVNLDNEQPTKCINQLIKEDHPCCKPITREQLIACTMNQFESIVLYYQLHGGKKFLEQYHANWMHSDKEVTIDLPHDGKITKEKGTIIGIDEAGFLRVRLKSFSQDVSMQPDGNTFDITRNLIMTKLLNT